MDNVHKPQYEPATEQRESEMTNYYIYSSLKNQKVLSLDSTEETPQGGSREQHLPDVEPLHALHHGPHHAPHHGPHHGPHHAPPHCPTSS